MFTLAGRSYQPVDLYRMYKIATIVGSLNSLDPRFKVENVK